MTRKDEEFRKHLFSVFTVEAKDHIRSLTVGLLELEKELPSDKYVSVVETIYRSAHSLKGAARAINLSGVEELCQSLETVFSTMKQKGIRLSPELFDALHSAVGRIDSLLASSEDEETIMLSEVIQRVNSLQLKEPELSEIAGEHEALAGSAGKESQASFLKDKSSVAEETKNTAEEKVFMLPEQHKKAMSREVFKPAEPLPLAAETVRIAVNKLDTLLVGAEELLSPKLAARQAVVELRGIKAMFSAYRQERARVKAEMRQRGRATDKLVAFIDWTDMYMKTLEGRFAAMARAAENDSRSLGRLVDNIIDETKNTLLLPFSVILEVFPRMVRDLSRDIGKEIELILKGGEVEIDKRILEEMKDAVIHLVRNSIDHGIEKPEERVKNKKPRKGTITLSVSQEPDGNIRLIVSDDGRGIDFEKVRKAAVKEGLISEGEAEALTEQGVISLTFHSGISTSPIITDISGRGLGLAIVQERVEKLGGSVLVESRFLEGTLFSIVLPSSMSTFRGLLVTVAEHLFVLPLAKVERALRVRQDAISTVENRETISLGSRTLSFAWLEDILGIGRGGCRQAKETVKEGFINVIVMAAGGKCIAFGVDEVVNEQEVLVRSLGRQLPRVRNIAGATVLGTGKVVPILDPADLVASAVKAAGSPVIIKETKKTEEETAAKKHILVVEDSITSRMLLRNILESSGYSVKTAVDGLDGFTALRTGAFALVISDVEMPRMNGFELTARIRSDKDFAELPVVLVTALDSRDDRERGIDAGANAYIVKSSFDQSNLLDVVKRLI